MTFTEAAAEVLRIAGKPLHYKEITELAIEKNLLSHVGKSPEVTMGARLAALLKKEDKENPIVRVKPGVFALREWDGKKGRGRKAEAEVAPDSGDDNEGEGVNALELERAMSPEAHAAPDDDDDEPIEVSGEDALRADLAASGAEMFDDEDDDDQPIFGGPASEDAPRANGQGGPESRGPGAAGDAEGGRRRRRRRRRRGGRDNAEERLSSPRLEGAAPREGREGRDGAIQPTAIVSVDGESSIDASRDPLAPAPRPMIRDRQQISGGRRADRHRHPTGRAGRARPSRCDGS
ncbi:MAG: winged helix-turn-helix domain-containing protein [Labilithrix sp.]